ncbi:MAG: hypothetical protein L3J20_13435, partial [Flavobacteriaceae bacterium]|nr:hypothetical protein [Flavobacteriaceae bacterium]
MISSSFQYFSQPKKIVNRKSSIVNRKSKDFNDGLGNDTIWERIKKTGEQKFYRVEYHENPIEAAKMTEEAKREKAKEEVGGKLKD